MTGHVIRPGQRRRLATLAAAAMVVAGCVGTGATLAPSASPSIPPESTYIAPGSFGPSPTPESTTVSPIPSTLPSVAPSVEPSSAPSVAPSDEPSAAPTDAPLEPFDFGDTDPGTGLKAEILQVGQWTATFQPSFDVTMTWTTPTSADTVVRVEGVTKCYAPDNVAGKDCVTLATSLNAHDVVLIAHGHASDKVLTWSWPAWEDIGGYVAVDNHGSYEAIIVKFTTGSSTKEVILAVAQTCPGCTY